MFALKTNNSSTLRHLTRNIYWPPPSHARSQFFNLPSGKKAFVFNAKSDQDGRLKPVLCLIDTHGNRLMHLDIEEVRQLHSLETRVMRYFELFEAKGREAVERVAMSNIDSFRDS